MTEKIKIIGLCGRSGSGKGYVCKVFAEYGIPSVDTDKVYRELLEAENSECLSELVMEFGDTILDDSGNLDRRKLAAKVFSDGEKLEKLNKITHKYILKETLVRIENAENEGVRAILIDAPVLFESGFNRICHMTVCVTAPDSVCIERICARDRRRENEALLRLANQKTAAELRELCDAEIVNDGVRDTAAQILSMIKKYEMGGKNEE